MITWDATINYRRQQNNTHARAIFERLKHNFRDQVFMDVENIKYGEEFCEKIEMQLQECYVFLVLIGPEWHSVRDKFGKIRLYKKKDWVRFEIATALRYKKSK